MIYCLKEIDMKLYRVSSEVTLDNGKKAIRWAGTQAGVIAVKKEWMGAGMKRKEISTEDIEVPTKKDELVEWLNERGV